MNSTQANKDFIAYELIVAPALYARVLVTNENELFLVSLF